MKNSLQEITTNNLFAEIANIKIQEAAGITRICQILSELVERKTNHPLLNNPITRWFREINSEKLHPEFAMAFCSQPMLIKSVIGLKLSQQQHLAAGGKISMVELDASYELKTVEKELTRFSATDIRTVFNFGKIRSIKSQEQKLQEKLKNISKTETPKLSRVRSDTEKNCLLISGKDIKIGELKEPLKAIGFKLIRIKAKVA
ncbi:MAG: hypothetical protein P8P29_05790 [Flavobacteriaceae bacterium]|nr:hypothetical protein [Flavobacteriaceae bacterium]